MEKVEEREVMVYLMTGFLESGKTQFLKFTLDQEYFQIDEPTVLLLCEEGVEEYDEKLLKRSKTFLEVVEELEDLTPQFLEEIDQKYHPGRVIFECNGMWPVSKIEGLDFPKGWSVVQKLTMVDASTFQMYLNNLKPLFVEMVRDADLVLFNRCQEDTPLAAFRRSVKVVNAKAEIIFEDEEGEIENIFEEQLPYDMEAPVVEIEDVDYGIWYVDMMDHMERYDAKTVCITARVRKPPKFPEGYFIAGRMAMTCCADDTTFLGYVCRGTQDIEFQNGQWMKITAKVGYRSLSLYQGKGPILKVLKMEEVEPVKDLVYFN